MSKGGGSKLGIVAFVIVFPIFLSVILFSIDDPALDPINKPQIDLEYEELPTFIDEFSGEEFVEQSFIQEIELNESDQTYVDSLLEELGFSFERDFGIVNTATILDANGNVLRADTNLFAFSVTDDQGNLIDLATVQFTFDGILQSEGKIVSSATIDLFLDNELVGTRLIAVNKNTENNLARYDIIEGNNRSETLTFTLLDEGEDWVDGSRHELRLEIRDIEAQVTSGTLGSVNFAREEPFILYSLQLLQDANTKVATGTDGEQVVVKKTDGVIQISGHSPYRLAKSCDNSGCVNILPAPQVDITMKIINEDGVLVAEIFTDPECKEKQSFQFSKGSRSSITRCKASFDELSRTATYKLDFTIDFHRPSTTDGLVRDIVEISTPITQQNYVLTCTNGVKENIAACTSNFGYTYLAKDG